MADLTTDLRKPIDFSWMSEHNRLHDLYERESDRAAAMLAAAFLDYQLGAGLESILVEDEKVTRELMRGYGPFSTFKSRIDVLYALGHLTTVVRNDLHLLRKVRNEFAHHPDVLEFTSDRVRGNCEKLSYFGGTVEVPAGISPRDRYLIAIAHCVINVRNKTMWTPRPKAHVSVLIRPDSETSDS